MLKPGDKIPMELGGEAEVTQLLGQGGQGGRISSGCARKAAAIRHSSCPGC